MPGDQPRADRPWAAAVAGVALLAALATHQIALAAYPAYFTAAGSRYVSFPLGWPWPCVVLSVTGQWSRFDALAFSADVLIAALLVAGAAAAAHDWSRTQPGRFPVGRRTLATIVVTALGWLLLASALGVPVGVFLGWAALSVIYLAVPAAAYALVTRLARSAASPRFSLRALVIVITLLCVLLAIVAWRRGQPRAERLARAAAFRVDRATYEYGVVEPIELLSGGRAIAWDYKVVERTQRIPAVLGGIFGVEYTIVSDPAAEPAAAKGLTVVEIWHYPRELVDPRTGTRERQNVSSNQIRPDEPQVAVVRLGSEPYLSPGEWKFELWLDTDGLSGERIKLLEQTFVVGEE